MPRAEGLANIERELFIQTKDQKLLSDFEMAMRFLVHDMEPL